MNRRLALAATGAALVAAVSACGSSDHTSMSGDAHSGMTAMSSPTAAAGSAAAGSAPAGSAAASAGAARSADFLFAQSMIPHHQQAVEMADLALAKASSAQVKALATQIKAAQDPEIATMRGWLTTWGAPAEMGMDHAGMNHMPGMMSDADMSALEAAGGKEFDTLWLKLMIAHHEGALTMANQVLATTSDAGVKTLAEAVVKGQTAEIDAMKALLAG